MKNYLTECFYYSCPKNLGNINSQIEERNINNILGYNKNINNDNKKKIRLLSKKIHQSPLYFY